MVWISISEEEEEEEEEKYGEGSHYFNNIYIFSHKLRLV